MNSAKLELTVGIFMLLGIICLGYLSIKLGKMELIGGNNYRITARRYLYVDRYPLPGLPVYQARENGIDRW